MVYRFQVPTPLEYFASLVREDDGFPLLEATLAVAMDEYPDLVVQDVLEEVDHLLGRLRRRLAADAGALQRLRLLNQFFFHDLGFGGNVNDYHDPDNSHLNIVLQRRRGIPITLAILWLELAQGIGLQARGVNFPGHFLVKVNLPQGQVVIDPFTGGSLGREDLSERLEPFKRRNGLIDDFDVPVGLYLQSASPRDILARVLRNLKQIHAAQDDWTRLLAVLHRMVLVLPDDWAERRDRGLALAELGRTEAACSDLEDYLTHAGTAPDAAVIGARLAALRRGSGEDRA
jgi:regulator of sirC expression with transglutaminase-like and TPR domain